MSRAGPHPGTKGDAVPLRSQRRGVEGAGRRGQEKGGERNGEHRESAKLPAGNVLKSETSEGTDERTRPSRIDTVSAGVGGASPGRSPCTVCPVPQQLQTGLVRPRLGPSIILQLLQLPSWETVAWHHPSDWTGKRGGRGVAGEEETGPQSPPAKSSTWHGIILPTARAGKYHSPPTIPPAQLCQKDLQNSAQSGAVVSQIYLFKTAGLDLDSWTLSCREQRKTQE